jgi:hypothetical protein
MSHVRIKGAHRARCRVRVNACYFVERMSTSQPTARAYPAIWVFAASCALLMSFSAPALAQSAADKAQAQVLFDKGRTQMKDKKFAEACPSFAESQRLNPAMGTQLNLAVCYEKLGKTASAWVNFAEIQTTARRLGQAKRAAFAKKHADALKPKLSKLRIDVPEPVEGLTVTRGDAVIADMTWGSFVPIDPGEHVIEAKAPGKKSWTKTVKVGPDADQVTLSIPALDDAPLAQEPDGGDGDGDKPAPKPGARGDASSDSTVQVALGWTAIAAGIAAAGAGVGLRVVALSTDEESNEHCLPDDPGVCTQEGGDLRDEAQGLELGSIIAWAAGGALLVTGVVVLLTAPSDEGTEEATARLEWHVNAGPAQTTTSLRLHW